MVRVETGEGGCLQGGVPVRDRIHLGLLWGCTARYLGLDSGCGLFPFLDIFPGRLESFGHCEAGTFAGGYSVIRDYSLY